MNESDFNAVKCRGKLERRHFPEGMLPEQIRLLGDVERLLTEAYNAGRRESDQQPQSWSNQSAFGYAIMAAERIGMAEAKIHRLVRALHNRFDMISLEEAAEHYRKSPY